MKASGYLVIWLMEPKPELFDRLNSYGHHAIQVTFPRDQTEKWQGMKSATPPERFFGFTHTEDAWKYLYTHPVGETGNLVKPEERCRRDF